MKRRRLSNRCCRGLPQCRAWLLPSTSGGHNFTLPQCIWQSVFVCSLLALLAIAWWEFGWHPTSDAGLTWSGLALSPASSPTLCVALDLARVPCFTPGSPRPAPVEEDYAFKEAVSRSFEGYRREMAELEGKAAPEWCSPCLHSVLTVITSPPGRIYEKHQLNKTPLNALAESAGPLAEVASKLAPGQIKLGA